MASGKPREKSNYRILDGPLTPLTEEQKVTGAKLCKRYATDFNEEAMFRSILLGEELAELAEPA